MPDAGELFSGFWDVSPSPVIDDLAAAVTLLSDAAVDPTAPRTGVVVLRTDEVGTAYADNGRSVVTYPAPSRTPSWVSVSSNGSDQVLVRGLDFEADDDLLTFDADPVTDVSQRTVWTAGEPVGAVTAWYGTAGTDPAAADAEDGTFAALVRAVSEACDAPYALGTETVEAVFDSGSGVRVVTDAHAYRLPDGAGAVVSVGDVLSFGDPLGSTWALTKLGPSKPNVPHLTTPASFHHGATDGGITWYDESVSLVIDTVSSVTRVRFRLGAESQDDLDAFWTASHANGVESGTTLALALDTRDAPATEPTAASLPSVVNPLELVCRELLAGNAWLLVVDTTALGADALGSAARSALVTAAAGPYTAVFVYDDAVPALTRYDPS